jgi:hypothetical protein
MPAFAEHKSPPPRAAAGGAIMFLLQANNHGGAAHPWMVAPAFNALGEGVTNDWKVTSPHRSGLDWLGTLRLALAYLTWKRC